MESIEPKKERYERCYICRGRYGGIRIPELNKILPCVCECNDIERLLKQQWWVRQIYTEIIVPENKEQDEYCPF